MSEEEEPVKESWDNRPVIFLPYLVLAINVFFFHKEDFQETLFWRWGKVLLLKKLFIDSINFWQKSRFLGILGFLFFSFF